MFFKTKSGTSRKSHFEGLIDAGFKAVLLAAFVSISLIGPMLVFILRDSIALAFTPDVMHISLGVIAGLFFFTVLLTAFTIRSIGRSYVKGQALNAMATKEANKQPTAQHGIIIPSLPQQQKQSKAATTWALGDIDEIPLIEMTGESTSGQPFVF